MNLSEIVRLKAPEKIGAAAAAILARNHGHRYCGWSYEGKYIIQTEEPNLSALRAVALYKELSRKSSALGNLKDVLDMRPIYHQTANRVQAHIFVAALAFTIHRAIEKS